jgi:peptide/nickel transport system substrate-binding protein
VTENGADHVERRPRVALLWREHRARWTLPLVIIVIIGLVATIDHLDSHRISQVDAQVKPALVAASGGVITVELDQPWSGFNPNTPAAASSSTPALLSSVLPSAYMIASNGVPTVNGSLLTSVEVTSTSPLTIQYVISPDAVWSDGVPVTADDFIYAWQSQRGDGVDIDGQPDQVASTLGYRDVASITPSHKGKTATVVFSTPYTDWRLMFANMVPAHIARVVGWNEGFDRFDPNVDISAGPMILQSVSRPDTAILIRNPKWWGTPAIVNRITINVASTQAAWTGVVGSSSRSVAEVSSFGLQSLDAVSSLPSTQSAVKPSLDMLQLDFNVTSPVAMRQAARQAIAHIIDRSALLDRVFGSIDPGLVVNQDHLAVASQSNYQQSSAAGEYATPDLATTSRLLKSIGFHQNGIGDYVDANGKQLTVRMAVETGDPWINSVAALVSAQLRGAGIAVVIQPFSGVQGMENAAAANSYDMALVTVVASPFQSITAAWYTDGLGPSDSFGTQNWSKFADPQVDALFMQAAEGLNPVSGETIYGQIDDQLWDQMVALPLFQEPTLVANGVQVGNLQYSPSAVGIMGNAAAWTTLKPGPPAGSGSTHGGSSSST